MEEEGGGGAQHLTYGDMNYMLQGSCWQSGIVKKGVLPEPEIQPMQHPGKQSGQVISPLKADKHAS